MQTTTLKLFFNNLKHSASKVGGHEDYKLYPKDETKVANLYLEARANGNKILEEAYLAILMLRHWKDGENLYNKTRTTAFAIDKEDIMQVLFERIQYACSYAGWNKNPKLNAQQCIKMAISTEVKNMYYFSNLDKYKANFYTMSMDAPLKEGGDGDDKAANLGNIISEDNGFDIKHGLYETSDTYLSSGADIVNTFIKTNNIVEAIILDTIANNDVFREQKTITKTIDPETNKTRTHKRVTQEFWPHKLVQALNALPISYFNYFIDKYKVKPEIAQIAIDQIGKSSNTKLYKYINSTLDKARERLVNYQ